MKGVDVSQHQGKIDWQKVKADGIEFAIIRAGFGMYSNQQDSRFQENMAGAKAAGVPVGVYWYSYALTPEEGSREAATCLEAIAPYQDQIVLPVWYDMEGNDYRTSHGFDYNRTKITDICKAFLDAVQAGGYRCGVYANKNWLESYIDVQQLGCPVWVAQWASQSGYTGEKLIWQYTSEGRVSGIDGDVDLDQGYPGLFPQQSGWQKTDGQWRYLKDGVPVKSQWLKDAGWWYYLDAAGVMLTGLQRIGGKVYCLNPKRVEDVPTGACIITDGSGAVIFP